MRTFFMIILLIPLLAWGTGRIYKSIIFDIECKGYLERAANANTVEYAIDNLQVALDYLDVNNIKDGYTSVFWRTPDEDVGYWYNNLLEAYKELWEIKANEKATALEKSNILMKLRETLINNTKEGDKIIIPQGISIHPLNKIWTLLGIVSFLSFSLGSGLIIGRHLNEI